MTSQERRRAVRAPAKLAMEVKLGGVDDASVESIDISANGVYFASPQHIPALTKLDITLALPDSDDTVHEVSCAGVVVRVEPEEPQASQDNYQIACYFTAIDPADLDRLEAYILAQLAF